MRPQSETDDRRIARIADAAHGTADHGELLDAGLTASAIQRRVQRGALFVEYRGVYRVGHRAPSRDANYMAATKAGGEGALIRGRPAAHLERLVKGVAPPPEVVTPRPRRVKGLVTRCCRNLGPLDGSSCRGIPVTSVPRTLVDLAEVLGEEALARACHEAGVLYGTTPAQVEAVLLRCPKAPGAAKLRRVLRGDAQVTLSYLEREFLRLLRREGLPLPVTNKPASGRRVDCRWPEYRLTVELDSYGFHNSRYSWEQGYRRAREARDRGDTFRRYSYGDVVEEPVSMLDELRTLLRRPCVSP